ncbi:hypothetical protein Tco_0841916 [Tanacetum coccineum]|uniref:Uncharacterized protein n=1 Tax=Tanacetum coccineum TaxID=301880 RepID=A0ABQ5B250_9ASTR
MAESAMASMLSMVRFDSRIIMQHYIGKTLTTREVPLSNSLTSDYIAFPASFDQRTTWNFSGACIVPSSLNKSTVPSFDNAVLFRCLGAVGRFVSYPSFVKYASEEFYQGNSVAFVSSNACNMSMKSL